MWAAGFLFKQALKDRVGLTRKAVEWRDFPGVRNTYWTSPQCSSVRLLLTCSIIQKLQHNGISSLWLDCSHHSGVKNRIQTLPHVRINYHRLRKIGAVSFRKGFHSGWGHGQAGGSGGHRHFQGLRRTVCVVQYISPVPRLRHKVLFLLIVKKKKKINTSLMLNFFFSIQEKTLGQVLLVKWYLASHCFRQAAPEGKYILNRLENTFCLPVLGHHDSHLSIKGLCTDQAGLLYSKLNSSSLELVRLYKLSGPLWDPSTSWANIEAHSSFVPYLSSPRNFKEQKVPISLEHNLLSWTVQSGTVPMPRVFFKILLPVILLFIQATWKKQYLKEQTRLRFLCGRVVPFD